MKQSGTPFECGQGQTGGTRPSDSSDELPVTPRLKSSRQRGQSTLRHRVSPTVGVRPLARDWMVGLEEVVLVVALLDISEAVDRLRWECLGHLEVLLRKVEVATGVIGLE